MNASPGARRRRLDVALVTAGLAATREQARALILSGRVRVDRRVADKPGIAIGAGAQLELEPAPRPFASRGGGKLAGALDRLGVDLQGWRCLDIGAATGGFTDVLLRRGAQHVTAVDVGRGLLDARLRADPRVRVVEGVNARGLTADQAPPPYDLITIDVSFISLTLIVPRVVVLAPEGRLLALVKPQFEVGRREASRGSGVIRDPDLRVAAVLKVAACLVGLDWGVRNAVASAIPGPRGNREVFLYAAPGPGLTDEQRRARVRAEVECESP